MPILSMFYGIIVTMYHEKGGKHHSPHIHVKYNEFNAVYSLDGELFDGDLPRKQSRLLLAWIELHADELKANWNLIQLGEQFFRINPL